MIDEYLGDLDRRLHGCGRFKADLLEEARDGLHDAADAYRAGGWSDDDAERRAVADFGPAAVVARDYQAELGMLSGVRTLWKLVLGVPAMQIAWDYARILTFGEWTKLSTPTPGALVRELAAAHGAVFVVPVIGLLALLGKLSDSALRQLERRALHWTDGFAGLAKLGDRDSDRDRAAARAALPDVAPEARR